MERMAYEVVVVDGKFFYKQSGELLHTTGESRDAKWIFVLGTSKILYVGKKKKGTFQHSSFLAGGATSAAGRLVVENGMLKVHNIMELIVSSFCSDTICCFANNLHISTLPFNKDFVF